MKNEYTFKLANIKEKLDVVEYWLTRIVLWLLVLIGFIRVVEVVLFHHNI